MHTDMTKNEIIAAIANLDSTVKVNKKASKADLLDQLKAAQKAAAGDGFVKEHNPDERTVWPRKGSARARVLSLMARDQGVTIDEVVKETGWKRGACASFFSTDVYGYRNKDEKWTGCNLGYERRGNAYHLIVHDDAPARPDYI